jgi:hypothetical protein
VILANLGPEAVAALLGAGGGWILAFFSELALDIRRARRARMIAALLIYGELTENYAALSALRAHNVWSRGEATFRRAAWTGSGPALLDGGDINRAGKLTMAYSVLEDIAWLAQDPARDFSRGEDAKFLDDQLPWVREGLREVARLTGLSNQELDRRFSDGVGTTE